MATSTAGPILQAAWKAFGAYVSRNLAYFGLPSNEIGSNPFVEFCTDRYEDSNRERVSIWDKLSQIETLSRLESSNAATCNDGRRVPQVIVVVGIRYAGRKKKTKERSAVKTFPPQRNGPHRTPFHVLSGYPYRSNFIVGIPIFSLLLFVKETWAIGGGRHSESCLPIWHPFWWLSHSGWSNYHDTKMENTANLYISHDIQNTHTKRWSESDLLWRERQCLHERSDVGLLPLDAAKSPETKQPIKIEQSKSTLGTPPGGCGTHTHWFQMYRFTLLAGFVFSVKTKWSHNEKKRNYVLLLYTRAHKGYCHGLLVAS